MDVTEIPFVQVVGIERSDNGPLQLPFTDAVHNHLHTVHAGAQFALAETASGEYLQSLFPELNGKVIPLMRDAQIKYRRPALSTLAAHAKVAEDGIDRFRQQFARKGRAALTVSVELRDEEGQVSAQADFNWFIQAHDSGE